MKVGKIIGNTFSRIIGQNHVLTLESQNESSELSKIGLFASPQSISDGSTNNRLIITDEEFDKGLVYADDYTGQFTTHSLVSKEYVDSKKPYKVYVALITQTASNSPVAIELENTFGFSPTFSYSTQGQYRLEMTGQFTSQKTVVFVGTPIVNFSHFMSSRTTDDLVRLTTIDVNAGGATNSLLDETSIEVRVYP